MPLKPRDICNLSCFINCKDKFYDKLDRVKSRLESKIVLPLAFEKYTIQYAPVGNYPENPLIIICGKTTSGSSHDLFIDALQNGKSLYEACFFSIYSNMRNNLFKYLRKIGLFDYLKKKIAYWETNDYRKKWDGIFGNANDSPSSGIQVTQAFNCAILNRKSSRRSSEPPKKIFESIQDNISCLFKHFRISERLKLIIFLDTPSRDGRFHQIDYWNTYHRSKHPNVKVISITHPSPQNNDIFNKLDDLSKINNPNKRTRAIKLLENAKEVIKSLSQDIEAAKNFNFSLDKIAIL